MGKLNKMALGLIEELVSIRDELGSAVDKIEGEGKNDIIRAHQRLADLAGNVSLFAGQVNLKNLLKILKLGKRASPDNS
jgi:hypothetical protein